MNDPRRLVSVIFGAVLFTVWLLVDFYLLPVMLADFGYGLYEPVAFGSWFVVILIILGVCVWGSLTSSTEL
ncbi:MAG: hypothetical protein ACFFEA_11985 [Candidatus Thorarchaeota archaeon]